MAVKVSAPASTGTTIDFPNFLFGVFAGIILNLWFAHITKPRPTVTEVKYGTDTGGAPFRSTENGP